MLTYTPLFILAEDSLIHSLPPQQLITVPSVLKGSRPTLHKNTALSPISRPKTTPSFPRLLRTTLWVLWGEAHNLYSIDLRTLTPKDTGVIREGYICRNPLATLKIGNCNLLGMHVGT